jgi:hypothetical protein
MVEILSDLSPDPFRFTLVKINAMKAVQAKDEKERLL